MSEQSTSIKELIWLASYYERFDMPENAQLILEALEQTKDSADEWAPIRYIEAALAKSDDARLSA
ncbi:MAG TPA: hypothetical protein V6C76_02395 [Drouetiella sp.]